MVGVQSHGQGLETALSHIAAQELGIDPAWIAMRHGDTESPAFVSSMVVQEQVGDIRAIAASEAALGDLVPARVSRMVCSNSCNQSAARRRPNWLLVRA